MRELRFTVPMYKVDILLIQVESEKDGESVFRVLDDFGVKGDETLNGIRDDIDSGMVNGGVTFRYLVGRKIAVLFYMFDSKEEMVNTYAHEKRHVEDRILDYFSINDSESAAILAGFLAEKFMEFGGKTYRKLKRSEKSNGKR